MFCTDRQNVFVPTEVGRVMIKCGIKIQVDLLVISLSQLHVTLGSIVVY